MFMYRTGTASKPAWFITLISLGLVFLTSGALMWVMRNGPPTVQQMTIMLAVLLLTPVFFRWQNGWLISALFLPWLSWLRRVMPTFNPGGPPAGAHDIAILLPELLIGLMLTGFMITKHLRKPEKILPGEKPLLNAMRLFVALCAIEIFNPAMGSIQTGLNGWRSFVLYMGLYWVSRLLVESWPRLYTWLAGLAISGGITGFYGFYQYTIGFPEYDVAWAKASFASGQIIGEQMRAFSTFSFTSTFSHYMLAAIFACWGLFGLRSAGYTLRGMAPVLMGFALCGLGVTFVRSSYMGMIIATVMLVVIAGKPAHRLRRAFIVMIIGMGMLMLIPSSAGETEMQEAPSSGTTSELVTDRLMSMRDPTKVATVSVRVNAWYNAITWVSTVYPVGIGIGGGASSRFGGDGFVGALAHTESQYATMLVETGFPGFILFCFITIYGVIFSVRVYDALENPDRKRLVLTMTGIQIALLVTSTTGGVVISVNPGSTLYWMALGIVAGIYRVNEMEQFAGTRVDSAPARIGGWPT